MSIDLARAGALGRELRLTHVEGRVRELARVVGSADPSVTWTTRDGLLVCTVPIDGTSNAINHEKLIALCDEQISKAILGVGEGLRTLRTLGQAVEAAVLGSPSREQLRSYLDRAVPDRAEHAALACATERGPIRALDVQAILDGLRRTADVAGRGYRPERAREEGCAEFCASLGCEPQAALSERWDAFCDAYDRARDGGGRR